MAFGTDSELSRLQFCVDIEILEKEYTLTKAQFMLSTVKSTFNFSGMSKTIQNLLLEFLRGHVLNKYSRINTKICFFVTTESQSIESLMDILINEKLYDLAFTIVLKFWKDSGMKRLLGFSYSFFLPVVLYQWLVCHALVFCLCINLTVAFCLNCSVVGNWSVSFQLLRNSAAQTDQIITGEI